jgi:hypothetical protein
MTVFHIGLLLCLVVGKAASFSGLLRPIRLPNISKPVSTHRNQPFQIWTSKVKSFLSVQNVDNEMGDCDSINISSLVDEAVSAALSESSVEDQQQSLDQRMMQEAIKVAASW